MIPQEITGFEALTLPSNDVKGFSLTVTLANGEVCTGSELPNREDTIEHAMMLIGRALIDNVLFPIWNTTTKRLVYVHPNNVHKIEIHIVH